MYVSPISLLVTCLALSLSNEPDLFMIMDLYFFFFFFFDVGDRYDAEGAV